MLIKYDVGIGGANANGSVFVDDCATEDEIRIAIMNSLYEVWYEKNREDDLLRVKYEVNVGGGCTNGETFVSLNATDEEILLDISYRLYYFEYEKTENNF